MQANQKPVIWSVVVATVLIFVLGMFATAGINSNLKLVGEKLDDFEIDEVALGNAIAAGIVIPEYDTSKIDELWDGVYYEQTKDLEDDSFVASVKQFLLKDNPWNGIEDLLVDVESIDKFFNAIEDGTYCEEEPCDEVYFVEGDELFDFLEDEYEDIKSVQFIKEYEKDREITVINLGLDDEDDRVVELSGVIRVEVEYDGDETERLKVYINSVVTSDDGDLEAEVTYSL